MITGYKFTMAGCDWTAEIKKMEDCAYKMSFPLCNILLNSHGYDTPHTTENIKKNLWEAIITMLMENVMIRSSDKWKSKLPGFRSLLIQAILQIHEINLYDNSEVEYNIQIGANTIRVKFNNDECEKKQTYGHYIAAEHLIELQFKSCTNEHYSVQYIRTVLIHELIHAVNKELDLQDDKYDSENNVNTLAHFLSGVYHTMKRIEPIEPDYNELADKFLSTQIRIDEPRIMRTEAKLTDNENNTERIEALKG